MVVYQVEIQKAEDLLGALAQAEAHRKMHRGGIIQCAGREPITDLRPAIVYQCRMALRVRFASGFVFLGSLDLFCPYLRQAGLVKRMHTLNFKIITGKDCHPTRKEFDLLYLNCLLLSLFSTMVNVYATFWFDPTVAITSSVFHLA